MEHLIEELYLELYHSLLRSAMSLTGNPSVAEDIVSAAFTRTLEKKEKIKSAEHLRRSLHVIVRNECINHLRSKIRIQRFINVAIYLSDCYDAALPINQMLEAEEAKKQLQALLRDSVEQLPRQRRKVIECYFNKDQCTLEIAQHLNLSGQTILNHKAKALDTLRKNSAKLRPLYRLCK